MGDGGELYLQTLCTFCFLVVIIGGGIYYWVDMTKKSIGIGCPLLMPVHIEIRRHNVLSSLVPQVCRFYLPLMNVPMIKRSFFG